MSSHPAWKRTELAQKFDAALISFIKAKRMLSDKFPDEHKICVIVKEAIMQVYEKLGWTEEVAKLSRDIATLKQSLVARENAWKKVASAAPPLAIAKKAA